MRKAALALVAGAVVCGAAAGSIRFVLVPGQERVQPDQRTEVLYAGTASFLDQTALASGDLAHAFAKDVPFTADEIVKTTAMHGETAVLSDVTTTSGPAAAALGNSSSVWAVDRTSLLPAAAPAGSGALDHKGLAVGFGFQPGAHDYPWWDAATQTQTTAKYVRAEQHAGRSTYVYTVDASGAAKDAGALPAAIPAPMLAALASTMGAAQAQALAPLLPKDGGAVPLSYASSTKTTMWVDKLTGTTVDAQSTQTITARMKSPIGMIPLTSVLTAETHMSPAGVAAAVKQSRDDESRLTWLGTVLPVGLTVAAAALLAGAAWLFRRRSGEQTPAEAAGQTEAVTASAL
jgi:hypothetical protein